MAQTCASRRSFLRVVGAGSALGTLVRCGAAAPAEPAQFGDVSAGNVTELPLGALREISGAPAYIGRDGGGVYAMTSTCTHEGCDMIRDGTVDAEGVYCSCHGSRFDANGSALSGPADAPLTHFAVDIDGSGDMVVHGGSRVSSGTRTLVPGG